MCRTAPLPYLQRRHTRLRRRQGVLGGGAVALRLGNGRLRVLAGLCRHVEAVGGTVREGMWGYVRDTWGRVGALEGKRKVRGRDVARVGAKGAWAGVQGAPKQ